MAYRFLLEVPDSRIDEANYEVSAAGDAQVLIVRRAHGLGHDSGGADLTVAAHSLRVIDHLYRWYDAQPAPKPEMAIVLHKGHRLSFADNSRTQMIGAIRRDQPWVERSIPRIGDHMQDVIPGQEQAPAFRLPMERLGSEPVVRASKRLNFLSGEPVAIKVTELDRAERYYVDFLGVDLHGRERYNDRGELEPVERDYNGAVALSRGTEADVSYLSNGPVQIALRRVGRGARLERDDDGPIVVDVDRETFLKINGDALMRGMEIVRDQPDTIVVRDIYGLVWAFRQSADIPALA
ncbi:MAG: hypothetical protein M3Y37_10125 [Chloroflexota bacterium]|nr:hypothetical protein [Chloroflexota bacterium]